MSIFILTSVYQQWAMIAVWLFIIIIAVYVEINTAQMVSIWFGVAAIIPAILAAVKVDVPIQIAVFVVLSGILFIISRPIAKKINQESAIKTNAEELVGEIVKVSKAIPVDGKGEIKSKYDRYTAIAPNEKDTIPEDTKVKITSVSGNKVIVETLK